MQPDEPPDETPGPTRRRGGPTPEWSPALDWRFAGVGWSVAQRARSAPLAEAVSEVAEGLDGALAAASLREAAAVLRQVLRGWAGAADEVERWVHDAAAAEADAVASSAQARGALTAPGSVPEPAGPARARPGSS